MPDYSNENRGAIWKNDRKETETQPDFKGSLNVGGKDYWVSAWKRKPDANPNAPALSFSVQEKEVAQNQAQKDAMSKPVDDFSDDSIPF